MIKRYELGIHMYLARPKTYRREFIFHFLNACLIPLGNSTFRIWFLSIRPPELLIKQAPLLKGETVFKSIAPSPCNPHTATFHFLP